MATSGKEEILKGAAEMLIDSPPGQIHEVLNELNGLGYKRLSSEKQVKSVFTKYNNEWSQVVKDKHGASLICHPSCFLGDNHYMDFNSGRVVLVDPVSQSIAETCSKTHRKTVSVPANISSLRNSLRGILESYVKEFYIAEDVAIGVNYFKGNIVVLISGERLNLRNYWAGRWSSSFEVNVDESTLCGEIKLRLHYFENGNVQMNTVKVVDERRISFNDEASFAEVVVKQISKAELDLQGALEDMYYKMSHESFKDMRRILPISRQKMDWSGAQMKLSLQFGLKGEK